MLENILSDGGALWALVAVIVTQLANVWMNRRKVESDTNTNAMAALNVGHKQLVDGLFAQLKALTDQVEVLRKHVELCDRQHREAIARIKALEAGVMTQQAQSIEAALTMPQTKPALGPVAEEAEASGP